MSMQKKKHCVLLYLCNGTINYAKTRNHFHTFFNKYTYDFKMSKILFWSLVLMILFILLKLNITNA